MVAAKISMFRKFADLTFAVRLARCLFWQRDAFSKCCIFEHFSPGRRTPFGGEASKIGKIGSSAHATFVASLYKSVAFLNTFMQRRQRLQRSRPAHNLVGLSLGREVFHLAERDGYV